jgi:hypothetical protein
VGERSEHDRDGGADDISPVRLPKLRGAVAPKVLVDFAKDVGHGDA